MFGSIIRYFHDAIKFSAQNPPSKLICDPKLCNYTPYTLKGPCRFCYGNLILDTKN